MTREDAEASAAAENAKGRPGVRYEVVGDDGPRSLLDEGAPATGGFFVRRVVDSSVRGRGAADGADSGHEQ